MIEIIEDCSPYYIRYKHTNSDKIIELCKQFKKEQIDDLGNERKFLHHRLPVNDGLTVLDYIPYNDKFKFIDTRVSLFVFQPGVY
jgi:hypothetical protein